MFQGYQHPHGQENIPLEGYGYQSSFDNNSHYTNTRLGGGPPPPPPPHTGAGSGYRDFSAGSYYNNNNNQYYNSGNEFGGSEYPEYSMGVGGGMSPPNSHSNQRLSSYDQEPILEPGRPPPQSSASKMGNKWRSMWGGGSGSTREKKPFDWKKVAYFCWFMSIIQVAVFIAELAKMGIYTGSPIQTEPSFNPMIGPSSYVMINMGSRFTPCMHSIKNVTDVPDLSFPCPNSTDASTNVCSLSELCGMGGFDFNKPHQWWRLITPIFLHAGFIHIGFNMLLQLRLGTDLEKEIGIIRFFLVYMCGGISGFLLGANYSPDGISSTGCSGSLFAVIALDLLDLLFNWQLYQHPKRALLFHIIEIIVSFVLGLLPGLDNFAHIGGFAAGIALGIALLRSPLKIRAQSVDVVRPESFIDENGNVQQQMKTQQRLRVAKFHWKDPGKHFKNRSRWWYTWFLVRGVAVALFIVYFVLMINVYKSGGGDRKAVKYLNCLPVNGWCDQGLITTTTSN